MYIPCLVSNKFSFLLAVIIIFITTVTTDSSILIAALTNKILFFQTPIQTVIAYYSKQSASWGCSVMGVQQYTLYIQFIKTYM